jgi:curved DNA-binding protein CbpA
MTASMKPTTDPYRVLGVLRGADREQIKAAHRRLAKLYHPDGSTGDEERFLAVQEAYQLLSDPLRRREWDRRHAPGPVRAEHARRREPTADGATAEGKTRPPATGTPQPRRGRAASSRTWTAERVPWWEDFRPVDRRDAPSEREAEPVEDPGNDVDVYSRSSGAAWSAAARRHFRRGTDDLPSRGVWRYRGTQVVTGAEARRLAAEEEEEDRSR